MKTFQNDRTKISTQTDVCPYQIRLSKCLNLPNFYIPHSDQAVPFKVEIHKGAILEEIADDDDCFYYYK